MEVFYPYPDDDYNGGAFLEEYNGEWSIVSASKAQDGDVFKKWGFTRNKDREPAKKGIPWKVKLGSDKREAAKCLVFMLQNLTGCKVIIEKPEGREEVSIEGDEIPF